MCSGVALSLGPNRRACVDAVGRVCGVRQLYAGFALDGTAAKRRFGSCAARWRTRRMSRRIASAFRLRTRVPSMLRCGRPWGAGADGSDTPGGHMRPDGRHATDGGAASMPACYVNLKDFKAVLPGRCGSATTRRFCYFQGRTSRTALLEAGASPAHCRRAPPEAYRCSGKKQVGACLVSLLRRRLSRRRRKHYVFRVAQ